MIVRGIALLVCLTVGFVILSGTTVSLCLAVGKEIVFVDAAYRTARISPY